MKILTRDEFRTSVFERDNHLCIMCQKPAIDAHHIIDRKLFTNGGYYIDNGVSLCSEHHIDVENGTIGCQTLRDKAIIKNIVLPEEFDNTLDYNKWGEPIAPGNRYKYPKTFHFVFSPGVMNDDRTTFDLSSFEGKEVVCTEKMDGENCVDGDVIIMTENGDEKIKDICESKSNCNVLSYNIDTNSLEYKQIIAHKVMEIDLDDEWFEIELENGKTVKLTSNHYVFLPTINAYRKVCDLNIDDDVIFLP